MPRIRCFFGLTAPVTAIRYWQRARGISSCRGRAERGLKRFCPTEFGRSWCKVRGQLLAFLGDEFLRTEEDLGRIAGPEALAAYRAFTRKARSLISPHEYYESDWKEDNGDPLSRQAFDVFLSGIKNETVRRYIEVVVHSDIATEPRHTSATYGLQNFLMNEPGYMSLHGINGGIERLPQELARKLNATIRLNSPVHRVEAIEDGRYRVRWQEGGNEESSEFDGVVVALPNNWIPAIDWAGPTLAKAMREHHALYNHPAHYLRATVLFREPFWRNMMTDSYFMTDAFGGCCVYDETSGAEKGSSCAGKAGEVQ
jgi:phytoene dehydrogenase-like protein